MLSWSFASGEFCYHISAKLGAQKKNKRNTTIQKDLSLDRTFSRNSDKNDRFGCPVVLVALLVMPTVDGRGLDVEKVFNVKKGLSRQTFLYLKWDKLSGFY